MSKHHIHMISVSLASSRHNHQLPTCSKAWLLPLKQPPDTSLLSQKRCTLLQKGVALTAVEALNNGISISKPAGIAWDNALGHQTLVDLLADMGCILKQPHQQSLHMNQSASALRHQINSKDGRQLLYTSAWLLTTTAWRKHTGVFS